METMTAMEYPTIVTRPRPVGLNCALTTVLLITRIAAADIVIVTTSADDVNGDTSSISALVADPGSDGISLREAILAAEGTVGHDEVRFDSNSGIILEAGLPPLADPDGTAVTGGDHRVELFPHYLVDIDAVFDIRSADNEVSNLQFMDFEGVVIRISGTAAQRNVVRGLTISWYAVQGCRVAFEISNGASSNVVQGCSIIPSGFYSGLPFTADAGVEVDGGAYDNVIGGAEDGQGNDLVAQGVAVLLRASSGNVVQGNDLRLVSVSLSPLSNLDQQYTSIRPLAGRPVSAAGARCVAIQDSHRNRVLGNSVLSSINPSDGILVYEGSTENVIGGSGPDEGNYVGMYGSILYPSHEWGGIHVKGVGADRNIIQGNEIGLLVYATPIADWRGCGILVSGGPEGTVIGGDELGAANWIYRSSWGIVVSGRTNNTAVQGNVIGAPYDESGWLVRNDLAGVVVTGAASGTLIGGNTLGAGNLIRGNLGPGLVIDTTGSGNTVRGNTITMNEFPNYTEHPDANDGIRPPWIQTVSPIGGQARPGAQVVFYAEEDLSLTTQIATAAAAETGTFNLPPEVVVPGDRLLLAIQTDPNGNTSAIGFHNHSGDSDGDQKIDIVELLRLIQFYNVGGYYCASDTEDGYAPGPGDHNCVPHAGDYIDSNWAISHSELLRFVQLYNSDGYMPCLEGEDGYCPGSANPPVTVW